MRLIENTVSHERVQQIMEQMQAGVLDPATITLQEYLQASMLAILYFGWRPDEEQYVVDGGSVYLVHSCVTQIKPPANLPGLRKMQ